MLTSKNILKQEQDLLKLNEEIDQKTTDLMAQVDQIKKMQSNNEIYSSCQKLQLTCATEDESNTEFNTLTELSDTNFAVKEYLSRIQGVDSIPVDLDASEGQKKESHMKKDTAKGGTKVRQPLKSALSLVGTQEQEMKFFLGITRHKSDIRLMPGNVDNDVVPETLKGVGHDGIVRFLTAKVKLLTERLEIMRRDERKFLEKIKELQIYKDKSTEEKERLTQQANSARSTLIKFERHTDNIVTQLQTTQAENNHLKKELEALKKEMRQNSKNQNVNEIKLNRTLEEVEKLKSSLLQVKQEEKETKEFQRKKIEELSNAVKKLDRQRTELLNGFKKQLLIIDNLKRQKNLIDAGNILKQAEDDFINFLDSNPSNVRHADAVKSAKS